MPLKNDFPTEYTTGGTPSNRGVLRRLNPMIFLTICCTLFILVIIAALIVFTFLPIFSSSQENQQKYQIQSDVLTLIYNLPDQLSILSMNWTYVIDELDSEKITILQNLLQHQVNKRKFTRKTNIAVMDAYIVRQRSPSTNLLVVSPSSLDSNNKTVIIITQPDLDTKENSTNQLIISLMLRYALECGKKCQLNLKESIFERTFHSLEVPVDTFQLLFTDQLTTSTHQTWTSNAPNVLYNLFNFIIGSAIPTSEARTQAPCIVVTPSSAVQSSDMLARHYEAESPVNELMWSTIQSCSVCSGEQKVSYIGFTNELIFQQITSDYGGLTTVVFYYITDRVRFAEIMVNNQSPSIHVTFQNMSPNQSIALLPIILNLCQGSNSIRIFNPNDYTPDFDRIVVY